MLPAHQGVRKRFASGLDDPGEDRARGRGHLDVVFDRRLAGDLELDVLRLARAEDGVGTRAHANRIATVVVGGRPAHQAWVRRYSTSAAIDRHGLVRQRACCRERSRPGPG